MTLREHLEAIRDERDKLIEDQMSRAELWQHAVAALAILDDAPVRYWERHYTEDEEEALYAGISMHAAGHTRGRWIPDPPVSS